MKLYITAKGRYVGTQADAKVDGKGWVPEEVPTDKEGLIAYLNAADIATRKAEGPEPIMADEGNDEHIPVLPPEAPTKPVSWSAPKPGDPAEELADWLYKEASDHYVYELITAIGSRFVNKARQSQLLT